MKIINPETMLKLELPLTKSYMNNEGYYHVAFSISTTEKDYYGHIITETALNSMVGQAKQININVNHQTGLGDIVGPVVDAWTETTDGVSYLWVDVRVRREWESKIKDMLDAGISLGGSIEAEITDYIETDDGTCYIDGIVLHEAALTTIPANNATLGTATRVVDGCPGSLCMQLEKHLKRKNMEVTKLPEENKTGNKEEVADETGTGLPKILENVSEKLEHIYNKISPEEGDNIKKTDDTKLNEMLVLERKNSVLEKEVLVLKAENKKLQNNINLKREEELVNKALKLNKMLDPDTTVVNKQTLFNEIKTLSNNDNISDIHLQLESYNRGLELILKKIPQGDLPITTSNTLEKSVSKHYDTIKKQLKELDEPLIKQGE